MIFHNGSQPFAIGRVMKLQGQVGKEPRGMNAFVASCTFGRVRICWRRDE
jgi:hypothetical protein